MPKKCIGVYGIIGISDLHQKCTTSTLFIYNILILRFYTTKGKRVSEIYNNQIKKFTVIVLCTVSCFFFTLYAINMNHKNNYNKHIYPNTYYQYSLFFPYNLQYSIIFLEILNELIWDYVKKPKKCQYTKSIL